MRYDRAKLLTILLLALTLVGLPGANGAESRASGSSVVGPSPAAVRTDRGNALRVALDESPPAPGDEIPRETLVPRRLLSASATLNAGAVGTFDALDAGGRDWYMNATNDAGLLAWQESYVTAAYLTMYEATGDHRYLDRFVTHADAVIAHTDRGRRVRDYRGKSLPAWRAGAHYTVGTLNLRNRRGDLVVKVIAIRRADKTSVGVRPGPSPGTFTLVVRNSWLRVTEVYRNLTVDRRSGAYFASRVNGTSRLIETRPLGSRDNPRLHNPRPMRMTAVRTKYYLFAVHTGMIAAPLARFASLVRRDPGLRPSYEEAASRCLNAAAQAVAVHNDEWVDVGRYGYYKYRRGAPVWADGLGVPHNQYLALGQVLLELYRATGEDGYRVRSAKLARAFKRDLRVDQNGAYVWNYWWGKGAAGWTARRSPCTNTTRYGGYRKPEDIVHGALDVEFVTLAAAAGVEFDTPDLIRFANTFHTNLTRPDGSLASNVAGEGGPTASVAATGGWLTLSSVSRDVWRTSNRILGELLSRSTLFGPRALHGVARNIQARHALKAEPRLMLAPVVRLAGPRPGPCVAGSYAMTVDATAEAPPFVTFLVDGTAPRTVFGPPYESQWSTTLLRDGIHRFRAVARDADGRSKAVEVRLVVDNTGPVVRASSRPRVISPNGDGYAERTTFAIRSSEEATALLRLVNVATRRVTVPATDVVRLRRGARSWIWDGRSATDGRIVPNGRYILAVSATDTLGNRGRAAKAPVGVNTTLYKVSVPWSARRGRPVSARYTLKYRAGVWVTVLGRRARVVARIHPRGIQSRGRHAVAWNGHDRSGEPAGRGAYTIVVYARNSHGIVSVVRRVRVTR